MFSFSLQPYAFSVVVFSNLQYDLQHDFALLQVAFLGNCDD